MATKKQMEKEMAAAKATSAADITRAREEGYLQGESDAENDQSATETDGPIDRAYAAGYLQCAIDLRRLLDNRIGDYRVNGFLSRVIDGVVSVDPGINAYPEGSR